MANEPLARDEALRQAMEHIMVAVHALELMDGPEYLQDARSIELQISILRGIRAKLAGFATRTYPMDGYMVAEYSGKWVAFNVGRLADSAGGGPCWSTIGGPTDTREAAEALCRQHAAGLVS